MEHSVAMPLSQTRFNNAEWELCIVASTARVQGSYVAVR